MSLEYMKNLKHSIICGIVVFSLLSGNTYADVRLPRLISDGAIFQRDRYVRFWGWADSGERISLTINNKISFSSQAKEGRWEITIPPQKAGGPHRIDIEGKNKLTINDIYFGDVWLASGQSNMEYPLSRLTHIYDKEIASSTNKLIRQFKVPRKADYKERREDLSSGEWLAASPETLLSYSAVAYFFAKDIHASQKVPIGIINSTYGGSAAQSWMSEKALKAFPHYLQAASKLKDDAYVKSLKDHDKQISERWYQSVNSNDQGLNGELKWYSFDYDFHAWPSFNIPAFWEEVWQKELDGVLWFQREIELKENEIDQEAILSLGRIIDADEVYFNGTKIGSTTYQYPQRRYTVPAKLLRQGKNRISVRVINNSGKGGFVQDKPYFFSVPSRKIDLAGPWHYKVGAESSAHPPPSAYWYKQPLGFFNAMIAPLNNYVLKGVIWYQGESNTDKPSEYTKLFPAMIKDWRTQWQQGDFPFIYTQLPNYRASGKASDFSNWAKTRHAQTSALSEPNTAMAVTIDVGEWNDIHPTNKKAVGERLALSARHLAYNEKSIVHSGPTVTALKLLDDKILLSFKHIGGGLEQKGVSLGGFSIKDKNGQIFPAKAKIKNNQVVVWFDENKEVTHVQYAWLDNPSQANLYNKEGLPAAPFSVPVINTQQYLNDDESK